MENSNKTLPASESRIYDVELSTRLGKRIGHLLLQLSGEGSTGIFHIMQSDNPIQGQFLENGLCTLKGSIRTLGNVHPFEGTGRILPESIEARLNCMGDSLPLLGTRKRE